MGVIDGIAGIIGGIAGVIGAASTDGPRHRRCHGRFPRMPGVIAMTPGVDVLQLCRPYLAGVKHVLLPEHVSPEPAQQPQPPFAVPHAPYIIDWHEHIGGGCPGGGGGITCSWVHCAVWLCESIFW